MRYDNQHKYQPLQLDGTTGDVESGSASVPWTGPHQGGRVSEKNKRRRLAAVWGILGCILVVLIFLALFVDGGKEVKQMPIEQVEKKKGIDGSLRQDTGGAQRISWDPTKVTFHKCEGSKLECEMVNKEAYMDRDFRNLSRVVESYKGVVAADHSRCSEIGVDILKRGGNAIDAAVAVGFCQGVVNPISSGIGGGMFMNIYLANGTAKVINAREVAPAAATATMFSGKDPDASLHGGLAIAVPLEARGLQEAHRLFGRYPSWQDLVLPAAELAEHGFAAHPYLVDILSIPVIYNRTKDKPLLREAFLIQEGNEWRPPMEGEQCCRRPLLAKTLRNIAQHGADYLYTSPVAETLAREIQEAGGIITANDIEGAQPEVRDPLRVPFQDTELLLMPPPSSSPAVAMALKFLAGYPDLMAGREQHDSSKTSGTQPVELHAYRMVEAMKHAFTLRMSLGDNGTEQHPQPAENIRVLSDMLNDTFIDELRSLTSDEHTLPLDEYGGRWNPIRLGVKPPPDDHGTSHYCVVDEDLNAVSITTTVNTVFGSNVVSPSTGIIFNNEMDDFSRPDHTSEITPVPSHANFIAPYKRPLSAMSPTIVLDGVSKKPRLVTGASGGPLIVSATLQTMMRILLLKEDPRTAVFRPRLHDQWEPDDLDYEENIWGHVNITADKEVLAYLRAKGENPTRARFLAVSQAVVIDPETKKMTAVSDPRKDGAPLGL